MALFKRIKIKEGSPEHRQLIAETAAREKVEPQIKEDEKEISRLKREIIKRSNRIKRLKTWFANARAIIQRKFIPIKRQVSLKKSTAGA